MEKPEVITATADVTQSREHIGPAVFDVANKGGDALPNPRALAQADPAPAAAPAEVTKAATPAPAKKEENKNAGAAPSKEEKEEKMANPEIKDKPTTENKKPLPLEKRIEAPPVATSIANPNQSNDQISWGTYDMANEAGEAIPNPRALSQHVPTDSPAVRGEKQWEHYSGHTGGRDTKWENNSEGVRGPYTHANLQTQDANIGPEKVHVLQTKHATSHTTYFDKVNSVWRIDTSLLQDGPDLKDTHNAIAGHGLPHG